MEKALHRQYYQILPLGGIVRTTTVESRTIDAGFYGVGLPNLGVEALVAMANKLFMHYGCNTAMGKLMQASYSLLFAQVGLLFQPLQESYECYGYLTTHSWIKMLWEKHSAFEVTLVVADANKRYPQENNQFIMQVLIKSVKKLNCAWVLQQLLFMLDILTTTGSKIDIKALTRQSKGETRLTLRWPNEQPTELDFQLWKNVLQMICPSKRGKGYSVLLGNCPAICSVIFVTSCHFCMGQNVLAI